MTPDATVELAPDAWRAREAEIDRGGMRALVAGFPADLRRAAASALPIVVEIEAPDPPASAIVVTGMGGSAIGGDLVAASTEDRRGAEVVVVRGYELPGWLDEAAVVVASSYSGETEETLAAYDAALERGLRSVAVTTGGRLAERAAAAGAPVLPLPPGLPPRAALGHSFAACALAVAALDRRLEPAAEADAIGRAAGLLEPLAADWLAWDATNPLVRLGADLATGLAVLHAGHPASIAAARRWQGQLAENAKLPAFRSAFPEHNHNQIVGLESDHPIVARLVPIWLETPWDHPRVRRRMAWVRGWCEGRVAAQHRFQAGGGGPLEGMLWLCHLGDCASFLASVIMGRDPTPVASIDALKLELKGR